MKEFFLPILLSVCITISLQAQSAEQDSIHEVPFSNGVNLTNWFQASSPRQIDFSKYTKQDFENIQSLGANVIRLPINLHSMVGEAPDYKVDSLFYFFLDQVIDWAEEIEINLILDNHTFDPIEPTDPDIGDILVPVWTQMAERYESRSDLIYYEVLNEPHGISNAVWNNIQLDVINAIRTVDSTHTIIVGPSDYNGLRSLQYMPEYEDDNLIYTFHFYDPFVLTHQGANWTDPSMVDLTDIPFPYDASKMPSFPSSLAGTWVQSAFNNYQNEGTAEKVREYLDIAVNFAETRGVRVFCGEFGVYAPNSDNDSRVAWYGVVSDYLTEKGLSWTIWDYQGGFGIFEPGSNELFDHDINEPLVEALGFTVPPQTEFVIMPDTSNIELYIDYTASGVSGSHNAGTGELDFFNQVALADGKGDFTIYWAGASQYNHIGFDFRPNKDLSLLVENEYELAFDFIGVNGGSFDLRFIDTKTQEEGDHPWRMNIRLTPSELSWDGSWEEVVIPLSDFWEMGSWDNETWYDPQGDFDWEAVDVLQIVNEEGSLAETQLWFDNIRIQGLGVNVSNEEESESVNKFKLDQNYPNPFNPSTNIRFELPVTGVTSLKVFDAIGREVATLIDGIKTQGIHTQKFDAFGLSSGVYFYVLKSGDFTQTQKMLLVK
ncbi:MAG: cellulase family glycosylhydrolase [Balneolaceae bacterium]